MLGSHVAGNLPRPVAGNGADRAGDQRVCRGSVAQNAPAAVADDFVSGVVEISDAVRLQVNPVRRIRLDRRTSVSVSNIHGAVFYEDAVCGIRGDNGTRVQDGGPAIKDGDALSSIVANDTAKAPNRAAEHPHPIAPI